MYESIMDQASRNCSSVERMGSKGLLPRFVFPNFEQETRKKRGNKDSTKIAPWGPESPYHTA